MFSIEQLQNYYDDDKDQIWESKITTEQKIYINKIPQIEEKISG